jgi:beta-phosphoglucomutase-like phosphatase (HAD superfamily)
MKFRDAIFDKDDVIIDSQPIHRRTLNKFCEIWVGIFQMMNVRELLELPQLRCSEGLKKNTPLLTL